MDAHARPSLYNAKLREPAHTPRGTAVPHSAGQTFLNRDAAEAMMTRRRGEKRSNGRLFLTHSLARMAEAAAADVTLISRVLDALRTNPKVG